MAPRSPKAPYQKPQPPPEVASWAVETMTPEIEALLGPVNGEAYLAALREFEETGGKQLEDFIGEIEEIVKRRD